jgi:2-phosphosulfolactate phosphatase
MKVEILEFIEGAKKARGLAVIIDVFRAFSVECYAFDSGALRVIATGTTADAFALRNKYKNAVLAGERDEKKIEGFDFGNSPTEIIKSDLSGRTFIHTTTAGTQGVVNALLADHVITGSLVNSSAIVRYIRHINPENVSLVAMGYRGKKSAEEDLLCAEFIADSLNNEKPDILNKIELLRENGGKRFFKPGNIDFSPPTDFFLCTMIDRFDFILKAERRPDGNVEMIRIDI